MRPPCPIPVDPEPWRQAFAALPVVVAYYRDPAELRGRIDEIGAGLDAEGTRWALLDAAAGTLDVEGVALVVPRDEAGDVEWLSKDRDTLARLDHPTIVFLQVGGPGARELAGW